VNLLLLFGFIHGWNEIKNNLFLRNSQPFDLLEQYKNMLDFKNIKSLGCKVEGITTIDKYNDIAAKSYEDWSKEYLDTFKYSELCI